MPAIDADAIKFLVDFGTSCSARGFSSEPVDSLGRDIRTLNVLKSVGIRTLGQFSQDNCERLFARKGVGVVLVSSLQNLCGSFLARFESIRPLDNPTAPVSGEIRITTVLPTVSTDSAPLFCDLELVLEGSPPRDRVVLQLYSGSDGDPLTLEAIGQHLGISRERVRQIKTRALSRLLGKLTWLDKACRTINEHLESAPSPLFFDGVHDVCPDIPRLFGSLPVWNLLFQHVSKGTVHLWCDSSLPLFALYDRDEAESRLVSIFRAVLSAQKSSKISDQDAVEFLLKDELRAGGLLHCADFIRHTAATVEEAYVTWKIDVETPPRWKTVSELVIQFLGSSGSPRSIDEIHRFVVKSHPDLSIRSLRFLLFDDSRIVFYSKRRYVLESFFDPYESSLKASAEVVEAFCSRPENRSRQWSSSVLLRKVNIDKLPFAPEDAPKVLDFALSRYSSLQDLGRSVWQAADGSSDSRNRVLLKDLVIKLLGEAGGQMSKDDLAEAVRASRFLPNINDLIAPPVVLRDDGMVSIDLRLISGS